MYSTRSGLVLGFHGCDEAVVQAVLTGHSFLKTSVNKYDWLGHGIYFWENSPSRAYEFAEHLMRYPSRSKGNITKPAVIGAVLDLGICLDLLDYQNLQLLKTAYEVVKFTHSSDSMPKNKAIGNSSADLLLKKLDCTVIEAVHTSNKLTGQYAFDSVRGVFFEGEEIYPTASFRDKDHIQICVRNPNCIKGFFLPREIDNDFPKV
jgi:hypothetical protein